VAPARNAPRVHASLFEPHVPAADAPELLVVDEGLLEGGPRQSLDQPGQAKAHSAVRRTGNV
jgi:hypothetical protein